jgi:threonine dehydrogenase-like Zn-dependent dehydrogenase
LVANVISYMSRIYNGERKYSYPTPIVAGTSAIGRVAAMGPDSVLLKPGQLVFLDCVIRGRDDPSAIILSGIVDGSSEGSRKLMAGEWRDSTYAEYVKAPLENCFPLNEALLCGSPTDGGLGHEIERLAYISALLVPYGGLRDIRLEAGETIIIAPATGQFGGAAVLVALAMGARVIAMGRNIETLAKLKTLSRRVETVQMTGNQEEEVAVLQKFGPADAFFDISPREAIDSTHIKSAILSLRHAGRISYMGGLLGDVGIPLRLFLRKDLKLHGKWMYSRDDIGLLVKMIEIGILGLEEKDGISVVGAFPLDKWQEAFSLAAKHATFGEIVLLKP